jgi:GNAT superfamily N-acetyltransferase
MTAPVVPVGADGWRQAGLVMARAFADDAVFVAMLPDSGHRLRALLAIMRWVVRLRRIDGRVDTTPDGQAVAVWRPPGYRETAAAQLRAAASLPPILRYCTVADIRRLASGMSRWERRRNEVMPDPHWVLEGVGVEPARQGLGLGVVLVRHGLARADAEHVPVLLEANSESNRKLWAKIGFEVIDYTDPADEPLGVPVWRMVRQPASSMR